MYFKVENEIFYKNVVKPTSCRLSINLKSSFTRVILITIEIGFKFVESLNYRFLHQSFYIKTKINDMKMIKYS